LLTRSVAAGRPVAAGPIAPISIGGTGARGGVRLTVRTAGVESLRGLGPVSLQIHLRCQVTAASIKHRFRWRRPPGDESQGYKTAPGEPGLPASRNVTFLTPGWPLGHVGSANLSGAKSPQRLWPYGGDVVPANTFSQVHDGLNTRRVVERPPHP